MEKGRMLEGDSGGLMMVIAGSNTSRQEGEKRTKAGRKNHMYR
jgi:hypothetical protein